MIFDPKDALELLVRLGLNFRETGCIDQLIVKSYWWDMVCNEKRILLLRYHLLISLFPSLLSFYLLSFHSLFVSSFPSLQKSLVLTAYVEPNKTDINVGKETRWYRLRVRAWAELTMASVQEEVEAALKTKDGLHTNRIYIQQRYIYIRYNYIIYLS